MPNIARSYHREAIDSSTLPINTLLYFHIQYRIHPIAFSAHSRCFAPSKLLHRGEQHPWALGTGHWAQTLAMSLPCLFPRPTVGQKQRRTSKRTQAHSVAANLAHSLRSTLLALVPEPLGSYGQASVLLCYVRSKATQGSRRTEEE